MVHKTPSTVVVAPLENLKGFALSRPPCIIFMVCLGLISVILMTLAFIVKDSELKKPDVTQDWNVFLESFAGLEFCMQTNTSYGMTTTSSSKIPEPTLSTLPSPELSLASVAAAGHLRNYSVSMMLAVHPTAEFVSIPHNLTYITGTISGSQIGLRGLAADESVLITMQLPYEWNTTNCYSMTGRSCDTVHIYTCVLFQASELVFPAGQSPEVCESINDTGVVYQTQIHAFLPSALTHRCMHKPTIQASYHLNPALTVMLSLSDRSLINLHLLHTSYFLFVMTITVLLYATIRGRPVKYKMTHAMSISTSSSSTI